MLKLFCTLVQFGFVAILFRQTNVIWVFFVTCIEVIDFLYKKPCDPSSFGGGSDTSGSESPRQSLKYSHIHAANTEKNIPGSEGMSGM